MQLIEAGDLTQAANRLGPMVSGKRSIRGGRSTPEAEEIDEVKKWLGEVVADPDDPGARFLVERSYYKLRSQLPKDEAQQRVAMAALKAVTGAGPAIGDRDAWLLWWQGRR